MVTAATEIVPQRRWLRFSLRTMFIVVTLAACAMGWLVWQMRIVQERKTALLKIDQVATEDTYAWDLESHELYQPQKFGVGGFEFLRVSRIRRLLGDKSYVKIKLCDSLGESSIRRIELAFPEAELSVVSYVGPPKVFVDSAYRDSIYRPASERQPNRGTVFKTGLFEK